MKVSPSRRRWSFKGTQIDWCEASRPIPSSDRTFAYTKRCYNLPTSARAIPERPTTYVASVEIAYTRSQ